MHTKGIDLLIIMNEKTTKRQHYIPQFYLKNFTDDSNKLWVYDRLRRKFFKNSPKDICCEKNLYETLWEDVDSRLGEFVLQNQMENKFAQQEGIYSFLLKRIINICINTQNRAALICNKDEKRILAGFVANLFLRNPWSLELAKTKINSEELINVKEIKFIDEMFQSVNFRGMKSLLKHACNMAWMDEGIDKSVSQIFIKELLELNFSILVSEESQFVTSSFPVLFSDYTFCDNVLRFSAIMLPFHPHMAILYNSYDNAKVFRNRIIMIEQEGVDYINHLYLECNIEQTRFIIARNEIVLRNTIAMESQA